MKTRIERFLEKCQKSENGCLEWKAGKFARGYGAFQWERGRVVKAHRASWMLFKGEIPAGLFVCHKCDNPVCVNTDHLFLGTAMDNVVDMMKKGRGKYPGPKSPPKGIAHHKARLNEEQVLLIRERAKTALQQDLAAEFNVSKQTISAVVRREVWRHI